MVATLAGCGAAWIGLVYAPLRPLYNYAWFVGFAVAAGAYLALQRGQRPVAPSAHLDA